MALDLAPDKIRVVCIIPGATDTPMLRQHAEREGKSLAELGFQLGELLNRKRWQMLLPLHSQKGQVL